MKNRIGREDQSIVTDALDYLDVQDLSTAAICELIRKLDEELQARADEHE